MSSSAARSPSEVRQSLELWVGCVAGALTEEEFLAKLREVGFLEPSIEPTRIYEFDDAKTFLSDAGLDAEVLAREVGGPGDGSVRAGHQAGREVRPPLPQAKSCCGPECCHVSIPRRGGTSRASRRCSSRTGFILDDDRPRGSRSSSLPGQGGRGRRDDRARGPGPLCASSRSAAVDPGRHRGGIGARLVEALVREAKGRGIAALYLFTPSAAPFFERARLHAHRAATRSPRSCAAPAQFAARRRGAHSAVAMVRVLTVMFRRPPSSAPGIRRGARSPRRSWRPRGRGGSWRGAPRSHPAKQVNPLAVEVLRRHGIEWSGRTRKSTEQVTGERRWDLLITVMSITPTESCQDLPGMKALGATGRLPDPHDAADFEATWSALDVRVTSLLALRNAHGDGTVAASRRRSAS